MFSTGEQHIYVYMRRITQRRQRRSAWDDIYKTYVQKTLKEPVQSKLSVPRIAIDVLLAVPRCLDVAGFARRRMYRGKVFSCGRIV